MKILFVSQYYYPERFKVTELAEELFKRGYEVDVLTGLPNYPEGKILDEYTHGKKRREVINGVNVIRVPLIGRKSGKLYLSLNYLSYAINASFKALFMKKDYDLVIVYQLSPILMALPAIVVKWTHKIPMVMYTFDLWPDSITTLGIKQNSFFFKLVSNVSRWIYRQADVQWVSSVSFNVYLNRFTGLGKEIVHLPQYAEDQFQLTPKEPQKKFNCLFAGNMGKAQNIETILAAAKILEKEKDIHFELVGSGSDVDRLKSLAKSMTLMNVHFAGSHPLEKMPDFYQDADVFLVTLFDDPVVSLTLPGKVQTYMASGRPVVGAVGGETAHVINESKGGRVVESGDAEGLAQNILYYFHNRDQVRIDGENARNYYNLRFHKQQFYDTILTQIEMIAARREKHVQK
jgi:glycosyltransferase involved in cell wall biosynthesis